MAAQYNRKDRFYQLAKDEGYLSRAAYKLLEIQKSYGIIKAGYAVFDVGVWPGGWSQVALGIVGEKGKVVGIDLVPVESIGDPRFTAITGDANDLEEHLGTPLPKFDSVISDMSPKLTGIRDADQAGIVHCAEIALNAAKKVLKPGGSFVVKLFKGNEVEQFVKVAKPLFTKVVRTELDSTRNTSNEFYLIGLGFKNRTP